MNQLNNTKIDDNQTKPIEPVVLLDCGQASKVTKGTPFNIWFELAPPPFDRTFL